MNEEIKEILEIRSKEQQAIDNLKAIINCNDKIIEIEPPLEDTAQILLDYITNLQEENKQLKDKIRNNEKCRRKMQKTLQQIIDKAVNYTEKSLNNPLCDEREVLKIVLNILQGEK